MVFLQTSVMSIAKGMHTVKGFVHFDPRTNDSALRDNGHLSSLALAQDVSCEADKLPSSWGYSSVTGA